MRMGWAAATLGLCLSATSSAAALELPCQHEDVLAETAASFLLSNRKVEASELLPEARSLGFDGVAVHAHEGQDDAALIQWLKELGQRSDGPLVCGEARNETRRLVLVSVRGGRLWLEGGRVRGKLAPGFKKPHLVVEQTSGDIKRIDVTASGLEAGIALPEEVQVKRIQLVAESASGPRPVAELVPDPEARAYVRPPEPPESEAARGPRSRPIDTLFARLDAFRHNEGAGRVRPNQALSNSAQRHAERVCELGKVAHRLSQGEDPETRLREEHIEARGVGEAVARADSADAAMSAVFESPSHRMAVTDRQFTDAGIGQAFDSKGHTCVVVLLAAWPRRIP